MRRFILAGALAAGSLLVAGVSPASAACDAPIDVAGLAYVTTDDGGVWLYVEDNGNPGLQRGGSSLALGEAGPCGEENPDTLVI